MILLNRASRAEKQRNDYTSEKSHTTFLKIKIPLAFTAGNSNKAVGTLAATCIALPAPVVEGVSGLQ